MVQLQTGVLFFMRIASFIVVCPGFSFTGMPNTIKAGLSFGLTLAVFSVAPALPETIDRMPFVALIAKEILLGLAAGYISRLIFAVMEIAGSLVDFQVGFSMAEVYDPSMGVSASNYGRVYYWLSMCIFFLGDIHHAVIRTLVQSFDQLPVGSFELGTMGTEGIVKLFGITFEMALNLAAPLMIVAVLTEVILALVSRSIPQINVLILGMPLKILVSFLLMLILLPPLIGNLSRILPIMVEYLNDFFFNM